MSQRDLDALRQRIAGVDQDILRLARERIDLARQVGRIKFRDGRPLRDYGTERIVFERTRAFCEELGLPFELGEGMLHVLIDEAVRVQEELRESTPAENPARALVVGGAGGMGRWLARYLEAQGHTVTVADPAGAPEGWKRAESLASGWSNADVVALAVPLTAGPTLYAEVGELPPGPLVFDIFSLKSLVEGAIRTAVDRGHLVASVHPMFGPTARLLSGRALVLCDAGSPEALSRVRSLFEATSLHLVTIPLEEHDRRMADTLGLSHALSLVFARALAASIYDAEQMESVASTTFQKQSRTTREIVDANPHLYFQIQRLNPHADAALKRLAAAVEALRDEVAADREEDFLREMEKARKLLDRL
jgi:prephenate dehydrogenase/chorismate mutase